MVERVEIQSKEIIDKMAEDLKVQPSMLLPRELGKTIMPVFNVNAPPLIKTAFGGASDSVSTTIHTTSTRRDTFLVAGFLTTTKDVVSTSITSQITFVAFGDTGVNGLVALRYEPVTAQGGMVTQITLPMPGIKLARGTAINVTNSTAIASIDSRGGVFFYETDPL